MENYKELELYKNNPESLICGLDEVGRGCSWGPMAVSGIILNPNYNSSLIADSKTLSAKARLKATHEIYENSLAYETICISSIALEKLGMTTATKNAMISCIESCLSQIVKKGYNKDRLKFVLIDALNLDHELEKSFPKTIGISEPRFESKSISVAAASIIAKVCRDNFVTNYSSTFPRYLLSKHKGYSTWAHFQALVENKPNFLHRKNFVKTLLEKENKYNGAIKTNSGNPRNHKS